MLRVAWRAEPCCRALGEGQGGTAHEVVEVSGHHAIPAHRGEAHARVELHRCRYNIWGSESPGFATIFFAMVTALSQSQGRAGYHV